MRSLAEKNRYAAIAATLVVMMALPLAASAAERAPSTLGTVTAAVSWQEPPRLFGLQGGWTVELDCTEWDQPLLRVGQTVTVLGWMNPESPGIIRSAHIRKGLRSPLHKDHGPDDDPDDDDPDDPEGDDGDDDDDDDEGDDDDDDDEGDDDDDDDDDDGGSGGDDGVTGVEFEVEGRLLSTTDPSTFKMDDHRSYTATANTEFGGRLNSFNDLIPGQILRVHARRIDSNTYIADEVELKGTGSLVDIDGLVAVVGVDHIIIDAFGNVAVTANTTFDGDADRLQDLQSGWSVLARVFIDQAGNWQAVRIRAESLTIPSVDDEDFEPRQALVIPVAGVDRQSLANRHDATIVGEVSDIAILLSWPHEIDDRLLAALTADPEVRGVEPNYFFRDPESVRRRFPVVDRTASGDTVREQQATTVTEVDKALEQATGRGTVVAILDTGVDPDHPLLEGKILAGGMDLIDGDFEPWETSDGIDQDDDGDIDESTGHGTFVASLLAIAAPDAGILPYRVLDDDGGGTAYSLAVALADAIENHVDVINLSLVYRSRSEAVDLLLEEAATAGIVIVCSAGNDGADSLPFPAADRHVLAVTALSADGEAAAEFANLAEQVVLAAPGEGIYGALPPDLYGLASGTSMAAPFVAAAAALILEIDHDLPPDLVRLTLEQSGGVVTAPGWGGVALKMHAALQLLAPTPKAVASSPTFDR